MKGKRRKTRRQVPLVPQQYEGRVECALNALAASVSATQNLSLFLTEQLGAHWAELDYLLRAADRDLIHARRWLRGALRSTRRRRGRR